jgi:propanol-preferring alcohol dehydrogenase
MAEMVSVPVRHLIELNDLDPVLAAPLTDAALTPYHAIALSRDRIEPSSTVVVIGVGGLGHMAVQILRGTSDVRIVAVDTDENRLKQATELGADHVLLSDAAAEQEVLRLTRGRGADVVLDFVGIDPTLALAAGCIASRGQITIVGVAGGVLSYGTAGPPMGLPWGVSVVRPFGGTRRDLLEVLALAEKGHIAAHVERFTLEEAPHVLQQLSQGEINGRAVLVP